MSINLHMFSILVSVRFLSKYVLLKAIQKKLSDNFGTLLEVVAWTTLVLVNPESKLADLTILFKHSV